MTKSSKPAFIASLDTQLLEQILGKLNVGETVAYDELTAAVGRDVQTTARGSLQSARNRLLRTERKVFDCVRGTGLVRLSDAQILDTVHTTVAHIHRTSRRALLRLAASEVSKLSQDDKYRHYAYAAHMGALHAITQNKAARMLGQQVREAQQVLPLAKTLEAFKDA